MNNNYKLSLEQITLITAVPALLITASCGNSLTTRIVLDVIIAAAGHQQRGEGQDEELSE